MARGIKLIPALSDIETKRFFSRIDASGDCHKWTGYRNSAGYGQFHIKNHPYIASRVAYFIGTGEQPGNLCVCHKCDNPWCVNPDHLFLGTDLDNGIDKKRKGRAASGDRHGARIHIEKMPRGTENASAKLQEHEVLEIRELNATRRLTRPMLSQREIAERYKISQSNVSDIIHRRIWKHI